MSLLKLKSKTEPLYTNKNNIKNKFIILTYLQHVFDKYFFY